MSTGHKESRRRRFRNRINRITRLRRANQHLHCALEKYQRLFLVAGLAAMVLGGAFGFVTLREPEPVLLGTGLAGLRESVERTRDSLRTADSLQDARRAANARESGDTAGTDIAGGEASYYGEELAGNRTASGEPFDPDALTAAHQTLPLGSRVRVTNVANGKSVVVRINDRGPFAEQRVIDLSRGAASRIGLLASGTGTVRMELLRS